MEKRFQRRGGLTGSCAPTNEDETEFRRFVRTAARRALEVDAAPGLGVEPDSDWLGEPHAVYE